MTPEKRKQLDKERRHAFRAWFAQNVSVQSYMTYDEYLIKELTLKLAVGPALELIESLAKALKR